MARIAVEIPIPPEVPASGMPARRGGPLAGQVWGLVDTSKVNADRFLSELRTLVEQKHHAGGFVQYRKPAPGVPLTAEQLARLSEACRAVVIAFGD